MFGHPAFADDDSLPRRVPSRAVLPQPAATGKTTFPQRDLTEEKTPCVGLKRL